MTLTVDSTLRYVFTKTNVYLYNNHRLLRYAVFESPARTEKWPECSKLARTVDRTMIDTKNRRSHPPPKKLQKKSPPADWLGHGNYSTPQLEYGKAI